MDRHQSICNSSYPIILFACFWRQFNTNPGIDNLIFWFLFPDYTMYWTLCWLTCFDMTHHHRYPSHGNKTTECCNSQDWFDPILTHITIWVHSQGYWVYTMYIACYYYKSAIISNGNGWSHKHWYILHGWNNLPAYLILKWNVFSSHL